MVLGIVMLRLQALFLGALLFGAMSSPALAEGGNDGTAAVKTSLDRLWVTVALIKVAMMQIGFMLLECGMVRSKTTINVAQKNLTDYMVAIGCFWLVGFMLMFGPSIGGLVGLSWSFFAIDRIDPDTMLFLGFQAVFCGTAATIVSGAVAERCSFWSYVVLAGVIGIVIYPVFGHWAWGGALFSDNAPFLAAWGFMDFAGSTVVHSVGAWVALAAVIVIGPRIGRFRSDGKVMSIPGHNPVLSGAGAALLMVGWIGFNGGSELALTDAVPLIVANTVVAGVFGGVGGLLYGVYVDNGSLKVDRAINGLLGGLVAVTAGANVFGLHGAVISGLLGGLFAQYMNYVLLEKWRLDDVVGAIGVHGFAGVLGTLLVAVLAPVESLAAGGRLAQLAVQSAGVVLAFVWAFGVAYIAMKLLENVISFRVSEEDEIAGLNTAEHGQTLGTGHLQQLLSKMLEEGKHDADLIKVEEGDEAGELSELFNMLLLRIKSDLIDEDRRAGDKLAEIAKQKARDDAIVNEINNLIERAADGDFSARVDLHPGSGVLGSVCTGMNRLFDAVDDVTSDLNAALGRLASGDMHAVMDSSSSGTFAEISTNFNGSVERFRETHEQSSKMMTMMTSESRQTAENASEALRDIEAASTQALGIVSIIEEIARKTNLLALNASIEASHAGERGAAFAVVADQVRSLASRVTDASSDINRIIKSNAQTVESGQEAVDEVRATLSRIEERILTMADRVEASASEKQAERLAS